MQEVLKESVTAFQQWRDELIRQGVFQDCDKKVHDKEDLTLNKPVYAHEDIR
jgi:hypothetical protein